ncbi:hypothetical protein CEXT_408001 [Caerostris extrusa]|uniref:Uncharacterized protein n=1 Tax=Caerostris extrusa TaxID=172846 RepID=A0AAV4TQA0_CAEEX|nr:hypothetical protein CEXT_408001 [Caerostris extrusa]
MRHSYLGGTGTPLRRRDTQDVMTTHSRPIPRDKNGAGIPSYPPASLLIEFEGSLTSHWSIDRWLLLHKIRNDPREAKQLSTVNVSMVHTDEMLYRRLAPY